MRIKTLFLTGLIVLFNSRITLAGEFYKLYPQWLEYVYHLFLGTFILAGLIVSYSIFNNLRGGKLGITWILIMLALTAILARTVLALLTIFDIAFFQAIVYAGLDVLFILLLLTGLILYKIGLN